MKRMIALLCAGVMSVSLCVPAFAGDGKGRGMGHEKRIDTMSQELELTADQKEKVSAIFKESDEKMKAEKKQAREKYKALRDETGKKLEEVLTPAQLEKHNKMMAERKDKMQSKMGKHKGMKKKGGQPCCEDNKPCGECGCVPCK